MNCILFSDNLALVSFQEHANSLTFLGNFIIILKANFDCLSQIVLKTCNYQSLFENVCDLDYKTS